VAYLRRMDEPHDLWMDALGRLRSAGWRYDQIATQVSVSDRSVRRWDQRRVRVQEGGHPVKSREAAPIPVLAKAIVELAASACPGD